VVYRAGNNSCLGGDRLGGYGLVVSCCLLFMHIELVEISMLEALELGA
jgi:hypothetical protein